MRRTSKSPSWPPSMVQPAKECRPVRHQVRDETAHVARVCGTAQSSGPGGIVGCVCRRDGDDEIGKVLLSEIGVASDEAAGFEEEA